MAWGGFESADSKNRSSKTFAGFGTVIIAMIVVIAGSALVTLGWMLVDHL